MKKANSDIKTEFAFFFSRDFFGVKYRDNTIIRP